MKSGKLYFRWKIYRKESTILFPGMLNLDKDSWMHSAGIPWTWSRSLSSWKKNFNFLVEIILPAVFFHLGNFTGYF